jgi:murein DD-endopeptidase MepM/ murein hydrolase activator NlpD
MVNPKHVSFNSWKVVLSSFAVGAVFLASACSNAAKDVTSESASSESSSAPSSASSTQTPSFDLTLSSEKAADGSLLFVEILRKKDFDVSTLKISLEGEEYAVFPLDREGKRFASLVPVPFNSKPRKTQIDLSWKESSSSKSAAVGFEVVDGNYRSETLQVDEKKVTPPKSVLNRIVRERKEIGAVYAKSASERYWKGPFILPLDSDVTSPFGNKRLYNGHMKNFHQGLDLRARTPTPFKAPARGKVVLAKDLYFTGKTVILDHGLGLFTVYAHMSRIDVKVGDMADVGAILGLTGATGRVSGPHLHWGASLGKQKFNPQDLTRVLR